MCRIDTDPLPQKVTRMGPKTIHPCSAPNYFIGISPPRLEFLPRRWLLSDTHVQGSGQRRPCRSIDSGAENGRVRRKRVFEQPCHRETTRKRPPPAATPCGKSFRPDNCQRRAKLNNDSRRARKRRTRELPWGRSAFRIYSMTTEYFAVFAGFASFSNGRTYSKLIGALPWPTDSNVHTSSPGAPTAPESAA
jgi:hypothetical protein